MHVFSAINDYIALLVNNVYELFIKGFLALGSDDEYYVDEPEHSYRARIGV